MGKRILRLEGCIWKVIFASFDKFMHLRRGTRRQMEHWANGDKVQNISEGFIVMHVFMVFLFQNKANLMHLQGLLPYTPSIQVGFVLNLATRAVNQSQLKTCCCRRCQQQQLSENKQQNINKGLKITRNTAVEDVLEFMTSLTFLVLLA